MNMFEILTAIYATGPAPVDREPSHPRRAVLAQGFRRIGAVIGSVARAFVNAVRERSVAHELSRLDDRTLRDIGLSRSDIPYVARTFAWSAPGNDDERRLVA